MIDFKNFLRRLFTNFFSYTYNIIFKLGVNSKFRC